MLKALKRRPKGTDQSCVGIASMSTWILSETYQVEAGSRVMSEIQYLVFTYGLALSIRAGSSTMKTIESSWIMHIDE